MTSQFVQAAKGAKAYEKAEDPIYALENNLPIDFQHYLEHHISQPILRIFEPMMSNPKDLLSGKQFRNLFAFLLISCRRLSFRPSLSGYLPLAV